MHRAKGMVPVCPHILQCPSGAGRSPKALDQLLGFSPAAGRSDHEDDILFLPVGQFQRSLNGCARVEPNARPARQAHAPHGCRVCQRTVATDELGAVSGDGPACLARLCEEHSAGTAAREGIAGEQGPAAGILLGHDVHGIGVPPLAQNQLPVPGKRQSPGASRVVAQLHHRELDRRVDGHVGGQLREDAVLVMLEDAVAETVPAFIRRASTGGQRSRRPESAGLLVSNVEGLSTGVADGIVMESRSSGIRGRSPPMCTRCRSR